MQKNSCILTYILSYVFAMMYYVDKEIPWSLQVSQETEWNW